MMAKKDSLARETQIIQNMLDDALRHHRGGRFTEAEQIYRKILAAHPRHPDCLHLLGMIAYQTGDLETAAQLIGEAISINAAGVSYYVNLGTVLQAQGELDEAEKLYRHALRLNPGLHEVHLNLGNVLLAQGNLNECIACYRAALLLRPDGAETHNSLGNALQQQGEFDAALACYRRALEIKPDYAEVYYNMGNACRAQGKLDEAVKNYHAALAIKPDYAEACYNLGNVFREQGKLDDALTSFKRALDLRPDYAQAGFGEALAQLLIGDLVAGWRNFERRWQSIDHDTPRRNYVLPAWMGERLDAGKVLLWGEQGVGDEIMFAGLIPDAVRTGNQFIVDCDPRLRPLFARSFPEVGVIANVGTDLPSELDVASQLPAGSLPGLFRQSISAFASTTSPYLIADPAAAKRFHARYFDGRLLVGLAWYTNSVKTGRFRSIDLSLLGSLFAQSNVRWVSLQYGDHDSLASQIAAANAPIFIDPAVNQLSDMDAFAAQIAAMDLVITIDNSTAHLAGALGVPVWVLLPFAPDWRWLLETDDSPWYPTMKLFRQSQPGDWPSVVEKINTVLSIKGHEALPLSRVL